MFKSKIAKVFLAVVIIVAYSGLALSATAALTAWIADANFLDAAKATAVAFIAMGVLIQTNTASGWFTTSIDNVYNVPLALACVLINTAVLTAMLGEGGFKAGLIYGGMQLLQSTILYVRTRRFV